MTPSPDTELFDLCKKVYELTGWVVSEYPIDWHISFLPDTVQSPHYDYPMYKSDYLLDKLPNVTLSHDTDNSAEGQWSAKKLIANSVVKDKMGELEFSDTPLKVLLKLVIALKEAGVEL